MSKCSIGMFLDAAIAKSVPTVMQSAIYVAGFPVLVHVRGHVVSSNGTSGFVFDAVVVALVPVRHGSRYDLALLCCAGLFCPVDGVHVV